MLIDPGAEIVVIPAQKELTKEPRKLYAANGSSIQTFGSKLLQLDLCLGREFKWNFIVASRFFATL